MSWKAKENILWFEPGDVISDDEMQENWEPYFDDMGRDKPKVSKIDLDVNKDGVVDKKDDSIIAKYLGAKGGRKSRGKRK